MAFLKVNLIYYKNILWTLEDEIYVIGPGPWLRPLCRDQERDFVQKSKAEAIYWNINIWRKLLQKSTAEAIYLSMNNICRQLLIHMFKNFNSTVSKKSCPKKVIFFSRHRKYDFVTDQKKVFLHRPENNISSQTRGRRWWRGSCCASTQDELQTKVTQHFLE